MSRSPSLLGAFVLHGLSVLLLARDGAGLSRKLPSSGSGSRGRRPSSHSRASSAPMMQVKRGYCGPYCRLRQPSCGSVYGMSSSSSRSRSKGKARMGSYWDNEEVSGGFPSFKATNEAHRNTRNPKLKIPSSSSSQLWGVPDHLTFSDSDTEPESDTDDDIINDNTVSPYLSDYSDAEEDVLSIITENDTLTQPTSYRDTKRAAAKVMQTLRLLELDLQRERIKHSLASVHFKALYDWFLFLPSILLTLAGGILSFMSNDATLHVDEITRAKFATGVGIVSLTSVFWQSLSNQLQFNARWTLHESAAVSLARLIEDIQFKKLDPDLTIAELDGYLKSINQQFKQALEGTTSVLPSRITSAFYSLQSELDLQFMIRDKDGQPASVLQQFETNKEELYKAACVELWMKVSDYWLFPFALPPAKVVVEQTKEGLLKKFQQVESVGRRK